MDYEKAYKEALERAKNVKITDKDGRDVLAYVFPELADSEDEKIRKEIIDFLTDGIWNTTIIDKVKQSQRYAKWINYIEKQKEQKPGHFELKVGKWYICHRAYCCRADHLTVKEGERFMCENDGVVKGFIIKEPEKYFIECGAPAPMEDEQKEQRPAEWSEEDKINGWTGVNLERYLSCLQRLGTGNPQQPETINSKWFKEHCHNQPKQEWSEEDEKMRNLIVAIFEVNHPNGFFKANEINTTDMHGVHTEEVISWLKSLRPQHHWKPSKEQMEALFSVLPVIKGGGGKVGDILQTLYDDLEKFSL